jgi:hypothetical protein
MDRFLGHIESGRFDVEGKTLRFLRSARYGRTVVFAGDVGPSCGQFSAGNGDPVTLAPFPDSSKLETATHFGASVV